MQIKGVSSSVYLQNKTPHIIDNNFATTFQLVFSVTFMQSLFLLRETAKSWEMSGYIALH